MRRRYVFHWITVHERPARPMDAISTKQDRSRSGELLSQTVQFHNSSCLQVP